jgi:tetratricopeptide (TPR) repeat protein
MTTRKWRESPLGDLQIEAGRMMLASPLGGLPELVRAGMAREVGASLLAAGDEEPALRYLQESAAIYRGLACAQPKTYTQTLVATLLDVSSALLQVGDVVGARKSADEARDACLIRVCGELVVAESYRARTSYQSGLIHVTMGNMVAARAAFEDGVLLRRKLAQTGSTGQAAELARDLTALGNSLWALREWRAAAAVLQESLQLGRRLASEDPIAYGPGLAHTLNAMGNVMRSTGEPVAALDAFKEALSIFRRAAAVEPAIYEPHVAGLESNIGVALSETGDHTSARGACEAAVATYRRLAQRTPLVYRPQLALALNNLGTVLEYAGDRAQARSAFEEALETYTALMQTLRGGFDDGLARVLSNLGASLREAGDREAARTALEKALLIRRRLAERGPATHSPTVGATLTALGQLLLDIHDFESARSVYEEALPILRQAAVGDPSAYALDVAKALTGLGKTLWSIGERSAARDAVDEASRACRALLESEPAKASRDTAEALIMLGQILSALGDLPAARRAHEDALAALRSVDSPHRGLIADALTGLSAVLASSDSLLQAREALEEALGIFRELAEAYPEGWGHHVAEAARLLGMVLEDMGENEAASAMLDEALSTYRRLAESEPDAFGDGLARALGTLAAAVSRRGDQRTALALCHEAYELLALVAPASRPVIIAHLASLTHDLEDPERGRNLAREAVMAVETAVVASGRERLQYSAKGEIESAYLLVVSDPRLADDTPRLRCLIEAMRDGESLGFLTAHEDWHAETERRTSSRQRAFLSIQLVHNGALFLSTLGCCTTTSRGTAAFLYAGGSLFDAALAAHQSGATADELVARAGRDFWSALPPPVQELLENPPLGGIVLSCDADTGLLPFELLTPSGRPADFLGLHTQISRIPGERLFCTCDDRYVVDGAGHPAALVFGNPWPGWSHNGSAVPYLGAAQDEAVSLDKHLTKLGFRSVGSDSIATLAEAASLESFLLGLRAGPSIVHFSGHGGATSADEYLIFARGGRLRAQELEQNPAFSCNPLVVLNSCISGRLRAHGGAFRGLPIAFLQLGAASVIASTFALGDRSAATMTSRLYQTLSTGAPVGEALLDARRAMHQEGATCSQWGFPVIYGNPDARLRLPGTDV